MSEAFTATASDSCPTGQVGAVQLRARGVRKAFGGQVVLDGIDLELSQGEVVLLRGENGSGKTTLLNILTGNLEPDAGTVNYLADSTPRSYSFPRRWWQALNPFDHFTPEFVAHEGIGRTWQDIRLFGSQSLRENIAIAERGHPGESPFVALIAPSRSNRRETQLNTQADTMLVRLGLTGRESCSADMVSLGQSKRVAIARAVAGGARILFLDEPLAGLDRQGIIDVIDLLESLVEEHKLTLVIIEHVFNQPHLQCLVSTDWRLENGRIHRNAAIYKPVTRNPQPATGSERAHWLSLLAGADAEVIDEHLPHGATLTRIRRPGRWKPNAKPILEIKGLVVKRGPRAVIGLNECGDPIGLHLTLHEGEIAILQAPNGWGKSTLFDAICGTTPTVNGSIQLNGSAIESASPWTRAQAGLAATPSSASLFPSLKVSEVARLTTTPHASGTDFSPFAQRTISSLSGGERQKMALLFSTHLSRKCPSLAIFDEPFAMLDRASVDTSLHLILDTYPTFFVFMPSSTLGTP